MPDSTSEAIDRLFDVIDKGVDTADRLFNRGKEVADLHRTRRTKREVIEAEATPRPTKKVAKPAAASTPTSTPTSTAVVRKPHFYITEAVDPKSGTAIFVVTDGGNARTECGTRAFAHQILQALEKA